MDQFDGLMSVPITDRADVSGLMPGAAPWPFTPDAGSSVDTCTPLYGGDIRCTTAYPSPEPQKTVPWPRDGNFTMTTDTGQG